MNNGLLYTLNGPIAFTNDRTNHFIPTQFSGYFPAYLHHPTNWPTNRNRATFPLWHIFHSCIHTFENNSAEWLNNMWLAHPILLKRSFPGLIVIKESGHFATLTYLPFLYRYLWEELNKIVELVTRFFWKDYFLVSCLLDSFTWYCWICLNLWSKDSALIIIRHLKRFRRLLYCKSYTHMREIYTSPLNTLFHSCTDWFEQDWTFGKNPWIIKFWDLTKYASKT